MSILKIARMGHPVLRAKARPLHPSEIRTPKVQQLIDDLFETMKEYQGVGLAAPQIGVNLRVVIFGVHANPRYPEVEEVPDTVLVNPVLEALSDETDEGWEGCLSVPGMRGWVPRWKRLRYWGFDETGFRFSREVEGFHARVVQHECDHLDGILYPQRMTDLSKFGFNEELFPGEEIVDE